MKIAIITMKTTSVPSEARLSEDEAPERLVGGCAIGSQSLVGVREALVAGHCTGSLRSVEAGPCRDALPAP